MPAPVYQKILVTLDGSDLAAQALPHAQYLAETLKARLILFRAVPRVDDGLEAASMGGTFVDLAEVKSSASGKDTKQTQLITEAEQALAEIARGLQRHQVEASAVIEVGPPAEAVVYYARREEIDLIVMCTHGRTGLPRLVYGSVAETVLRTAPCPVLLIRAMLT